MNNDIASYNYDLSSDLIAKHPPKERGSTRLLLISKKNEQISHSNYANLAELIEPGTVIVINDTRVIPARVKTYSLQENSIDPDDSEQHFVQHELIILENHSHQDWLREKQVKVLYRGTLKAGQKLYFEENTTTQEISVLEILGNGIAEVSTNQTWRTIIEKYGTVPIPPYLKREEDASDRERYQTVVAANNGSVAAPTASLNLTNELLEELRTKGAVICFLTLHVGLGTFLPIRVDDLSQHKMHSEYYEIPLATCKAIQSAKKDNRPILAIGTTVTRTLECAAHEILTTETDLSGEADIFIYPGYEFKIVDQLLTNFHAPKSTVLMMAAAFTGWPLLKNAYQIAASEQYQFLSYGDSMLIK